MASQTVENYIKAIFQLTEKEGNSVTTSALADHLTTSAASVTDMLKKLADQKLIEYIKYKGVRLSTSGKSMAVQLIRKHRLWETFLFEKLTIMVILYRMPAASLPYEIKSCSRALR